MLDKILAERHVVVPAFFRTLRQPDLEDELRSTLSRELAFLNATVSRVGDDVANLSAIHVATHWVRMDWLRDLTPLPGLIDQHPVLKRWLDLAAALPAVQRTLPNREETVERYRQRFAATTALPSS